jgi:hypothetical protein
MSLFGRLTGTDKYGAAQSALIAKYTFSQLTESNKNLIRITAREVLREGGIPLDKIGEYIDKMRESERYCLYSMAMAVVGIKPALKGVLYNDEWYHISNPFAALINADKQIKIAQYEINNRHNIHIDLVCHNRGIASDNFCKDQRVIEDYNEAIRPDLTPSIVAKDVKLQQNKLEQKVPPIEISEMTEQSPPRISSGGLLTGSYGFGITDDDFIAILKATITENWLNETPNDELIGIYNRIQFIDKRTHYPDIELTRTINTLSAEIKKRGLSQDNTNSQKITNVGSNASEAPGLSLQQSPVSTAPIEKNKQKTRPRLISWQSSIIAFVIAFIGNAFLDYAFGLKAEGYRVFWDWIWISLIIEGWKYWKWKALLLYPIVIFVQVFVIVFVAYVNQGKAILGPVAMVGVMWGLNMVGLIICYGLLSKLRKENIEETTILKQSDPLKMSGAGFMEWQIKLRAILHKDFVVFIIICITVLIIISYIVNSTKREEPAPAEAPWVESPVAQPAPSVEAPAPAPISPDQEHFDRIKKVHPDYEKYRDDGSLKSWIDKQPAYLRKEMQRVYNEGESDEVIDLYSRFKKANNIPIVEAPAPAQPYSGKDSIRSVTYIPKNKIQKQLPKRKREDNHRQDQKMKPTDEVKIPQTDVSVTRSLEKQSQTSTENARPSVDADQHYKGIKGIVLMNGNKIEGQIISMSPDTVKIRTKDGNILSYDFKKEVERFIHE